METRLQPNPKRPDHSKHLQGGAFDGRAQTRVDARPAHHVGAGVQPFGDAVVQGDKLDQAEMRIVEIEEQIDVAVRPRLVLGPDPNR